MILFIHCFESGIGRPENKFDDWKDGYFTCTRQHSMKNQVVGRVFARICDTMPYEVKSAALSNSTIKWAWLCVKLALHEESPSGRGHLLKLYVELSAATLPEIPSERDAPWFRNFLQTILDDGIMYSLFLSKTGILISVL